MPRTTFALLTAALAATSCQTDTNARLGAEVQVYPAGVIAGATWRKDLDEQSVLIGRVAANFTDRGDWGEQDDESGEGFGIGVAWRRTFAESFSDDGWLIGARIDGWALDIDWKDDDGPTGSTDVIVLQPTVEGGYGWTTESGGRWELMLGFGAEINVDEDGRDVGDGAIGLLGLTWLW